MNPLRKEILSRLDNQSLYDLHQEYPSLRITEEWKRRLSSCDPEEYTDLLDFLIQNPIEKDKNIKEGLENLKNCFPWRIGVVYNYETGRPERIEVKVGETGKYKSKKGIPLTFTWLHSEKSKLLVQELTSSNAKSLGKNITSKTTENVSKTVRDYLFQNPTLKINIERQENIHNTFDQTLPRENFFLFPTAIILDNHRLGYSNHFSDNFVLVVKPSFSPDALKLQKLLI